MTAPALTTWTCAAELEAMDDADLADALRKLAADARRPVALLLFEAADRLGNAGMQPGLCPACGGDL